MTTQKQHQSQSRRSAGNWLQSLARLFSIILAIMIVAMSTYWGMKFYEEWQNKQAETERNEQLGLSHDEVTDEEKANHAVDGADKPKLLSIPAAGVQNARVQEIGLLSPSSNGSQQMDAPQNVHDVGWYNCQINPIESKRCANYVSPAGTNNLSKAAVMDGHSCSGDGCVFDGLVNLKSGDEINVTMGDDSVVTYVVDYVQVVDLADLDMEQAMTVYQPGKAGLNLITCDGSWSSQDSRGVRTMDRRVVVYSTIKE